MKMKKGFVFEEKNCQRGFTLIEMLLVIGIIGILAAVVLAAINPVEQINKANDSGQIDKAKELIGGAERLYTSRGVTADCTSVGNFYKSLTDNAEMKTGLTYKGIVMGTCAAGDYTFCFAPASKVYQIDCAGGSGCGAGTNCEIPDEIGN